MTKCLLAHEHVPSFQPVQASVAILRRTCIHANCIERWLVQGWELTVQMLAAQRYSKGMLTIRGAELILCEMLLDASRQRRRMIYNRGPLENQVKIFAPNGIANRVLCHPSIWRAVSTVQWRPHQEMSG